MPGSFALLLHAHLPFVRHPEHEFFLEEDWLFEAITESYLPLLRMLHRLTGDNVPFRLTISLTPTLCAMLRDELLQRRYLRHLERSIGLARQEMQRRPEFAIMAKFYCDFFTDARAAFESFDRDLVGEFRELQERGAIEIIASSATHAFLPLLQDSPEALRAQVRIGCEAHRQIFGREPRGFWLPECGFCDRLDSILQDENIRWFVLDAHGLLLGRPRPRQAIFAPCYTPAGPAAFARDRLTAQQIWSDKSGYPGDPVYRDFYCDIGFERAEEDLSAFVRPEGLRKFTGLKYHRITGPGAEKQVYDPPIAIAKAEEHARDFIRKLRPRFLALSESGPDSVIVAPFDAELFGHWWFEGPHFLEKFIRHAATEASFALTTPSDFLGAHPSQQIVAPNPSSWGRDGFSSDWVNENNAWMQPRQERAARRMTELAGRYRETADSLVERTLQQAARELLLAQSSDWRFLISNRTAPEYATRRAVDHLELFDRLCEMLEGQIDREFLCQLEDRDNLFANLDWRYYL